MATLKQDDGQTSRPAQLKPASTWLADLTWFSQREEQGETYSSTSTVLCRLRNIEELDLSGNQFEGSLLPCLGNLSSLRLLAFEENNLKGIIPASLFANLSSLEYVSLSSNNFEGSFSFHSFVNSPKLEVFEVTNNNNLEVETESLHGHSLSFQLRILRLSNCTLNKPSGTIPSFLASQRNLRIVDLSHNGMLGNMPSWLLRNNTSLEYLSLTNNSLVGSLELVSTLQNRHLFWFDVSGNHIGGEIPSNLGFAFPNLVLLNMSRNKLQGVIPPSLGEMIDLYSLDLSNNSLSGELPDHLAIGCVNLTFLVLSNNYLHGKILPENSNLKKLRSLHLDNNHFSGSIPKSILNSTRLSSLDISHNAVSGGVPDWIGELKGLSSLVLSNNSLEGPVPTGLCQLSRLRYLDLSHNHLGSTIPSCFNISSLKHFHMQNNHLCGPIPSVLSRASSLVTLDLRDNQLSGGIPGWISCFPNLRILLLRGNNLEGPIPFRLCQLPNISIIDFSHNRLSGSIPSCLKDIEFGRRSLFDGVFAGGKSAWTNYRSLRTYLHTNKLRVYQYSVADFSMYGENDLVQFATKKRYESFEGNVLYYMSGLDFSYNELTGPIPPDIGLLSGIHTLNFSHNSLTGSIPKSFSNLGQIESLDLSYNMLSGEIPPQLVSLSFLSVFNVTHNNLSGSVPEMKGQFATFDQSSYEGNSFLCGPPLKRNCSWGNKVTADPGLSKQEDDSSFREYFLYGFLGSFVTAFVAVAAFFYLDSRYLALVLKPSLHNPHLFSFNISSNHISGDISSSSRLAFPNLQYLNMSRSTLQDAIPPSLGEMKDLDPVDLSDNLLSSVLPDHLSIGNVSLTFFKLPNNHLHKKSCQKTQTWNNLWSMLLSNNHFTEAGSIPSSFSNLNQIESLDLSYYTLSSEKPNFSKEEEDEDEDENDSDRLFSVWLIFCGSFVGAFVGVHAFLKINSDCLPLLLDKLLCSVHRNL
ncbi:hypothetical protein Cgig2_027813 [Carnegiea gigantea]|uniref:Uncharacterized protein n=1 Tax=Carnegiea gigantea TaxID=171969 RepID=A0A9Q1QBN0_9CARY|nr:hypothetical protein Cgig2_027813 [Carnegiea gigantea]